MQYACTYVLIPEITILGHSDHITGITIEFALKFDAICMYICPDSRNYHIRLLQSQNRYLSSLESRVQYSAQWTPSGVQSLALHELNGHPLEFNIQLRYAHWTPSGVQYSAPVSSLDTLRSSTFNYSELIGHPPEFNIQLR